MLRAGLLAVSLMLFGWALPGGAQPTLVSDVNPDPVDPLRNPATLSDFTSLGSRAVFLVGRANEAESGSELWTTDGTDAGTERLRSFFGFRTSIAGGNGRIAFFFVTAGPYPPPGPVVQPVAHGRHRRGDLCAGAEDHLLREAPRSTAARSSSWPARRRRIASPG